MGWGGIDLIPIRDGESPQDAVDRVYGGGIEITLADGVPVVSEAAPGVEPDESPRAGDRGWILDAVELLETQLSGWTTDPPLDGGIVDIELPEGIEDVVAENPDSPFWALLTPTYMKLSRTRRGPAAEGDWALWWQMVQRFADAGCAAFLPDTSELLDPSLDEVEANERYLLL